MGKIYSSRKGIYFDNVLKEANLSNFKGEVYVYQKTFMGIPVPEVKFRLKKVRFPVSTVSESVFIDVARQSFLDAVKLILELSRIEIKAWKLAEELKKTVIRVNALEKYYIPEYEKNIKMIKSTLEEQEREFLYILKKIS